MISNCLKIQDDLYSPSGAKPPAFMDNFGFKAVDILDEVNNAFLHQQDILFIKK
jgi:hypothetical protein